MRGELRVGKALALRRRDRLGLVGREQAQRDGRLAERAAQQRRPLRAQHVAPLRVADEAEIDGDLAEVERKRPAGVGQRELVGRAFDADRKRHDLGRVELDGLREQVGLERRSDHHGARLRTGLGHELAEARELLEQLQALPLARGERDANDVVSLAALRVAGAREIVAGPQRGRAPLEHAFEARDQLRGGLALRLGEPAQERAQRVDRAQQRVGHGRLEGELPVSKPHQEALEHVRESGDVLQPQEPRRALDAVDRAKDLVHRLRVDRAALLQLEQERLDRLEMLERFDHELRDQTRIREHDFPSRQAQRLARERVPRSRF